MPHASVQPSMALISLVIPSVVMSNDDRDLASADEEAKEIVMEFIQALERKDFKTVRSYISDNISVVAPGPVEVTTFNKAEPFMTYLEHANLPPFDIKKEFADSKDVCLLYEVTYREPVKTFVCGWFHVNDDGKISSLRFVLDPRPLFQQKRT
jgi:limonene-1,2-epoxide hydrolase